MDSYPIATDAHTRAAAASEDGRGWNARREVICAYCGHPCVEHGEDGVCRPVLRYGNTVPVTFTSCSYGCRWPVYPKEEQRPAAGSTGRCEASA